MGGQRELNEFAHMTLLTLPVAVMFQSSHSPPHTLPFIFSIPDPNGVWTWIIELPSPNAALVCSVLLHYHPFFAKCVKPLTVFSVCANSAAIVLLGIVGCAVMLRF